jgi:cytochrome c biogenesis protein CcdA
MPYNVDNLCHICIARMSFIILNFIQQSYESYLYVMYAITLIYMSCILLPLFIGHVYYHFQQYFSYIVAVSFIGGEIRITWRKPPT